jgi:hypothetical protein
MNMSPESYKLFAIMCESVLPEASSSMGLVQSKPGGKQVVQYLHARSLAHDQDYKEIEKISWSVLKDASRGAWVIVHGKRGVGAIRAEGGAYRAVASTGGTPEAFNNDRGGNILDFFKTTIGGVTRIFVGTDTGEVTRKQNQREKNTATTGPQQLTKKSIVNKFKPLWVKGIVAAQADIKGMIANMIKNDAFTKAKKKLIYLESLDAALDGIESGDTPSVIVDAVSTAVLMTASHYYPETTGEISKDYRGMTSEFSRGPQQILQDISEGDTKKLGTILSFFKRTLISG